MSEVQVKSKNEPDEEMLKHLDLLLNMEALKNEEQWELLGEENLENNIDENEEKE